MGVGALCFEVVVFLSSYFKGSFEGVRGFFEGFFGVAFFEVVWGEGELLLFVGGVYV